jgi:hypothetical protein
MLGCDPPGSAVAARTAMSATSSTRAIDTKSPLPGMDCLVNVHGIRRKVIPRRQDVRVQESVPVGSPAGTPLAWFLPLYVFAEHPVASEGRPEFYLVGDTPRRDSVRGWVMAADVEIWDTRLGARNVSPVAIYSDIAALEEIVRRGHTDASPVARPPVIGDRKWMPWPIAEIRNIKDANGRLFPCLRFHFIGKLPRATVADVTAPVLPAYSSTQVSNFQKALRQLDVVFVIDSTGSMTPYIEAVKEAVLKLSEELRRPDFRVDVAFGLVAYRDYDSASAFVTREFDLASDPTVFLSRIADLRAEEGGDEPEAVYDGIRSGLEKSTWRGEGLSTRVVVLVGDCPAHEPGDPQNPRGISARSLVDLARRQDIRATVFTMAVGPPGGDPLRERREQQFQFLARETGGACLRLDEAPSLIGHVRRILESQVETARTRTLVFEDLSRGQTPNEIADARGVDIHQVTQVVEFLAGAGVAVNRLQPGDPVFSTGWCLAEDDHGRPSFENEVWVARAEVSILLGELHRLCAGLSPDLPSAALWISIGPRIGESSYFGADRPETFDLWLLKNGIPSTSGILKFTREDIAHMDERRRAELRRNLTINHIPELTRVAADDRVFRWVADLEFGWVPESLFP